MQFICVYCNVHKSEDSNPSLQTGWPCNAKETKDAHRKRLLYPIVRQKGQSQGQIQSRALVQGLEGRKREEESKKRRAEKTREEQRKHR